MKTQFRLRLCLLFAIALGIYYPGAIAQTSNTGNVVLDTLVTQKNEKMIVKVTKVTETELEYKKDLSADAPIYVIGKEKLKEIRFGNGTREELRPDEMAVNQERQVIDKRSAIKFQFFSPINNQVTFAYEHSIKVGTNLEISAGLINNSMISNTSSPNLIQGGLFKAGVKFLIGENYYIRGMQYAHPLKGRYIKPEICYSSFIIRGVSFNSGYPYGSGQTIVSDERVNSVAIMLNYGRQFILGNVITFGYSVGLGYSFLNTHYTNPDFNSQSVGYGYPRNFAPSNLYTHSQPFNGLPIAIAGTVTVGYLFK
jgi:hypothetical protein